MKSMQDRATISVTAAAKVLGVGRNAAYAAAARGDIPVIRIGKRMRVPIPALEKMLAVRSRQEIIAAELVRRLRQDESESA